MGIFEIYLLAIGLSIDAFAVSITIGLSIKCLRIIDFLIPCILFGFFQAFMPVIGYVAGNNFASYIKSFDHWLVFILLCFIGGKMLKKSFSKEQKDEVYQNSLQFLTILLLAILTSIDALSVGIAFALLNINIFFAIAVIGVITFIVSLGGMKIGNQYGSLIKSKAEFFGGVILILIGTKILIEHLLFLT